MYKMLLNKINIQVSITFVLPNSFQALIKITSFLKKLKRWQENNLLSQMQIYFSAMIITKVISVIKFQTENSKTQFNSFQMKPWYFLRKKKTSVNKIEKYQLEILQKKAQDSLSLLIR